MRLKLRCSCASEALASKLANLADGGCPASQCLMVAVCASVQRWRPFSIPDEPIDFVRGLFTICGAGRCLFSTSRC